MPSQMSCDEIVTELAAMLDMNIKNPGFVQRTLANSLTVMYEFQDGDAEHPYHFIMADGTARLAAGALPYDACDVVIRTTPDTLHRLLHGELGGREAIISGVLDIRKAPSMAKLLVMRALFNRYIKASKRATSVPDGEPSMLPDTSVIQPNDGLATSAGR